MFNKLFKKLGIKNKKPNNKSPESTITEKPVTDSTGLMTIAEGAYLVFDPASNGSMLLVWSKSEISGALAYGKPGSNVPEFKYTNKGGKSEMMRNLMSDKQKYYEAWCQFFKTCSEFNSQVTLLPGAKTAPLGIQIIFLYGTNVVKIGYGTPTACKGTSAIACIPSGSTGFDVKTLNLNLFLSKARSCGGGAINL